MEGIVTPGLYGAGAEVVLPTWALGLAGGAAVVFVAGILTVLIALVVYQPHNNRNNNNNNNNNNNKNPSNSNKNVSDTRLFGYSVIGVLPAAASLVQEQAAALYTAITDLVDNFVSKLRIILFFGALALASLLLLYWHPELLAASYTGIHCFTQPFLEQYVLPLFNAARIFYSFSVAFVNAIVTVIFAWTRLPFRVIRACTSFDTLAALVTALASAIADIVIAVAVWLGTGFFQGGRIELLVPFQELGFTANATRPIVDCLCVALDPVWDFVIAVPQVTSLHTTLDCAANVPARAIQLVVLSLIRFEMPRFHDLASEVQCTVRGLGDTVEDVLFLVAELFSGVYTLIRDLFITQSGAVREALTVSATAVDSTLLLLWPEASARLARSGEDDLVQFARQWQPFGDQLLDGLDLFVAFGFDTLMRLLGSPYSRIVTEPVAALVGAANMTLETVFHPIEAFTSTRGIAYFQLGHLGDCLRTAADAIAQLSIVIDARLPCSISQLTQTVVSLIEAVGELLIGFVFHAAFSPWTVGEPPPVNCSAVPCDGLPGSRPADWSFLDVFPDYYAWNGNRLRRSYVQLLAGGECTAYLFGCDTAALNNPNGTNVTDLLCANAPAACLARSFNRVAVDLLNTSLALVFFLPDIVRFNRDYLTAADLPLLELEASFTALVQCIANWLDTLDENDDMCATTTVPEGPIEPGDIIPLPPPGAPTPVPPGQSAPPIRTTYDCRVDGRAYYLDGRAVIVTLTTLSPPFTFQEQHLRCDPDVSRRCAVSGSSGGAVQVLGSSPEQNITLFIGALPSSTTPKLQLFMQANGTNVLLAQPSPINTTALGIATITNTSCADAPPLPDPLPESYACRDNRVLFIDVLNTANTTRRIGPLIVNASENATEIPCAVTGAYECNATSNTLLYLGRPVLARVGATYPFVDVPLACDDPGLTCQLNRLMVVPVSPIVVMNNESFSLEVFYTATGVSTTRFPVPCERVAPVDYVCNATRVSINNSNVLAFFDGIVPEEYNVFCAPNALGAAPACTRIVINYTASNASAVLEVEGAEVRAFINGSRVAIPCQYASARIVTSSATVGPDRVSVDMKTLIARTNLRVVHELRRTDLLPRYSRADMAFFFASTARVTSAADSSGIRLSAAFVRASNNASSSSSLYRKESLLCCFSATVRAAGVFVVATVFEIVIAARDLLVLPAYPELGYAVPTFADARDALRDALCKLACTVTQLLPVLSCDSPLLVERTHCSTSNSCTRNVLCALFDLPILIIDYAIDILATLRSLAQGETPGDDANILGVACAPDDVGGCFVSVLSYVVIKGLRVFTALARNIFAFLDCLVCGLTRAITPGASCDVILLAIFEPILQAIEQLAGSLLTLVLNLVVGFVEGLVYLFTGQWDKLFEVVFVKFFENIALFGRSVFDIIVNLLLAIPGVRDIVNFVLSIARDACTFIEGLVKLSVPETNFNCGSIPSAKKRGTMVPLTAEEGGAGWLPSDPVWATPAAHDACAARMALFNASTFEERSRADHYEILYCQLAAQWVGPHANTTSAFDGGSECDTLMPSLYAAGTTYPSMSRVVQQRTVACLEGRAATTLARHDGAAWLPDDLFYNVKRWVPLFFDALLAHDVYAQYSAERSLSAQVVLSAQYRYAQRLYGGAATAAHLDALAADRMTLSAAAVAASLHARSATAYAQARVDGVWAHTPTSGDAERIGNMAQQFWGALYEGNGSIATRIATGVADFFAARADAEYVSVTPSPSFFANIAGSAALGLRGFQDAWMLDLPSLFVRATRISSAVHQQFNTSALASAMSIPVALGQASLGAMMLVSRTLGGSAAYAAAWLDSAEIRTYLAMHAHAGVTQLGPAGVRDSPASNMMDDLSLRVSAALASLLPTHSPLQAANTAFQRVMADRTVSPARARRLALSRFGARIALTMSAVANGRASSVLVQTERERQTFAPVTSASETIPALPCQFYLINATDNSTTYPFCETCAGLDQSLGYTLGAGLALITYFTPNATSRTSFSASTDGFYRVKAYLADPSAPAVLGDSPGLPARWPWKDFDNWRVLGDDRPNKKRFSSIAPLAALTYNYVLDAFGESGGQGALDSLGGVVSSTADKKPFAAKAGRSINAALAAAYRFGWQAARLNVTHLARPVDISALAARDASSTASILLRANMVRLPESGKIVRVSSTSSRVDGASIESPTSIADIIFAWVVHLRDSAITCAYKGEINGENVQFSIGEILFIVLIVCIGVAIVLSLLLPSYFLTILGGVGVLFGLLVLFSVWWLAYDWSYGCLGASPITFGDDFVYFLVFNLATRCSGGGFVDQADYNNSNCAACANWRDGYWTIPNFYDSPADGGRFGFEDFTYNIVYGFRWLWPAALATFQRVGPTVPVFGAIVKSDLVQARLLRFAELDFAAMTPVAYSQYTLGFVLTAALNVIVFIAALALAGLVLGTVLRRLFGLLQSLILIAAATLPASIFSLIVIHDLAFRDDDDDDDSSAPARNNVDHNNNKNDSVEMTAQRPLLY